MLGLVVYNFIWHLLCHVMSGGDIVSPNSGPLNGGLEIVQEIEPTVSLDTDIGELPNPAATEAIATQEEPQMVVSS